MNSSERQARRFTIGDAMILIAATGFGTAFSATAMRRAASTTETVAWTLDWISERVTLAVVLFQPTLIAWTFALILLGLRLPRPRWRNLSRRPGMTALLTVALSLAMTLPLMIGYPLYSSPKSNRDEFWNSLMGIVIEFIAIAGTFVALNVLTAWLVQILQRRWNPEPTWIDRSGRMIGFLWMLTGFYTAVILAKEIF